MRSRRSWGHGDLRDLAELAAWSARELGAGFVLINPLHAAEPLPPVSPSPYLPMTRRFISPLYLRVEDIPEYGAAGRSRQGRIERAGGAAAGSATPAARLIDRDAVWRAKRAALEIVSSPAEPAAAGGVRRVHARRRAPSWRLGRLVRARGAARARLADLASGLRSPRPALAAAERARLAAGRVPRLAAVAPRAAAGRGAAAARAAGMGTGVIHDLAVGVHPGGADAWAHRDVLVPGHERRRAAR